MTVPGAVVPCAAVTAVGVVPTHRRRGLLTAMMRRQLEDVHARGEPVAILWASEGAIYGRFGYGIAAREARLTARRPAARLAAPPPAGDPLRAGPAADHVEHMRAVYERVRGERPGLLDRPGPWWDGRLYDPESRRQGAQPLRALIVPDGYALYAVRPGRDDEGAAGEVVIRELVATTPEARALLWDFLLDQDLTRTVTWTLAPPDDPLWLMLTDPDAVRIVVGAALWARVVDVQAALERPRATPATPTSCSTSPTSSAPGTPGAIAWPAVAASARTPSPTWRSTRRRWARPTWAGPCCPSWRRRAASPSCARRVGARVRGLPRRRRAVVS